MGATLTLMSCRKVSNADLPTQVIKIQSTSEDIRIPKIIFENIISDIKNESMSADPVYLFQPLDVVIESESGQTPVVKTNYQFSNGGGVIDLKNSMAGQGSFYFYFPPSQFEKFPPLEHLYFINENPKQKIDQENFGMACGSWTDLQLHFADFNAKNIKLNTTQQRHLFVAAGYYVFVFRKGNQVYLTHLHLTDSRYKNLKCPEHINYKTEAIHEHK